jgi:hypothetical protein
MNEHRSIVIRHDVIRQDYINGEMRIGGVSSQANTSDILTKNLQPPLHLQHTIPRAEHITRIEAIYDTQSDILDSFKRLFKFTTELNTKKKLYTMSFDVFDIKKQAALPQFKCLCDRTIRVTMDGQLIAGTSKE